MLISRMLAATMVAGAAPADTIPTRTRPVAHGPGAFEQNLQSTPERPSRAALTRNPGRWRGRRLRRPAIS